MVTTTRFHALAAGLCALALPALAPATAPAQEAAEPVVYASYLECDPAALSRVDSLVTTFWGPIWDRHVSAGHATAWGWLAHHTGGTWDRVFYFVSPDVNNALDAVEGANADAAANARLARESAAACPVHEDYIWQRIAGSQPAGQLATTRPAAGFSIYYECDPAREQLADYLATTAFAPALDRLVQSGDVTSWSWMQHLVGGKYRRILVTDGRDAKTLIAAIGKLVTDLRADQPDALRAFNDICDSHQDNVWRIQVSRP